MAMLVITRGYLIQIHNKRNHILTFGFTSFDPKATKTLWQTSASLEGDENYSPAKYTPPSHVQFIAVSTRE